MAEAGDSGRGGAKVEVCFVLLAALVFLAAFRLRETGVFDRPYVASTSAGAFSISNEGMLNLINAVAAIPDRTERLRRIDEVVAEYGDNKLPHIDYGVTWMLVARAVDERTNAGKIAAYDAILRRYSSREGLSPRTAALLDWVTAKNASLKGDTETLKKVAEDNAGASRSDQRHARMFALNELGNAAGDVAIKRQYYDQVLAEYREGKGGRDSGMSEQAAEALSNKAAIAKGEERKALLRELLEYLQPMSGEYARGETLWAESALARDVEPAERLGLFEELVGKYKDDTAEYIQNSLRKIVGDILDLARKRPERGEILDRLAAGLRGSVSKNLAARVLMERAEMLSGDAERAGAYRAVVSEFKDTDDTSAREQVVSAARSLLKFSDDKAAAAQICRDVASLYENDTNWRVASGVAGILTDVAGAVPGDTEKLAAWNNYLEYAKRHPNSTDVVSVNRALTEKAHLENAPDIANRFFSEWIAGAGSDDELCDALNMKLSYTYDSEISKEASKEIIAEFADTRDAEQAWLLIRALGTRDTPAIFPKVHDASDEKIRLYSALIDRFAGAEDEGGVGIYMSALLEKAENTDDVTVKAALCDRVLAAPILPRARSHETMRVRAAKLKSDALDDPGILTQYYTGRAAKASSASATAKFLLSQAGAEISRAKKEALLDQIIAKYSDTPGCETTVMSALNDRAYLAADREEARRRFRETVEYFKGIKRTRNSVPWLLPEAYRKLVDLAPGKPERIVLYDEQIQFHLENDRKSTAGRSMLEKAELLGGPESIALYDRSMELLSDINGVNDPRLLAALFAKAKALEDDSEKNALYDRIIEQIDELTDSSMHERYIMKANAGKANIPGGVHYFENSLDMILQRESIPAVNIWLATALVEEIDDSELRDAGYEKIFQRYSGDSSSSIDESFVVVRLSRARSSGDFDEYRRIMTEPPAGEGEEAERVRKHMETLEKEEDARKEALDRRLADESTETEKLALLDDFIDRAVAKYERGEIIRLLFRKAEVVADADVKARVYDEILDRTIGWRNNSTKLWWDAPKVIEARATLIGEPDELAKYYDSLIEQYRGTDREADYYLMPVLYLNRSTLIIDRAERKAMLESAIAELEGRGTLKRRLEPLYNALADLNA